MAQVQMLQLSEEELGFLLGLFRDYHVVHVDGSHDYPFLPQWLRDREADLHNKICQALGKPNTHP